jgi:hypothetical protein|tara:strand:+ start:1170 stop:1751 length:582 start_codon:yes stop_codon:yes gene_type:complete
MKKLITILLLLISSVTYSQVINYNSFDGQLIDSLLFIEINNYRTESKSPQLIYSEVLHNGLSKYITGVLVKQQSAGHPNGEKALNSVSDEVYNEIQSKFPNKVLYSKVDRYSEVSLVTTRLGGFTTYQELAVHLVDLWKTSSGHDWLIKYWGSTGENVMGIASGSVQVGDYYWKGKTLIGVYASFQISVNHLD